LIFSMLSTFSTSSISKIHKVQKSVSVHRKLFLRDFIFPANLKWTYLLCHLIVLWIEFQPWKKEQQPEGINLMLVGHLPCPSAQIQIEDLTVHPLRVEWPSLQNAVSPKKALKDSDQDTHTNIDN
jgi:hypothetical protein